MNAESPPFKNREHNSESASTIDRVITPSISRIFIIVGNPSTKYFPQGDEFGGEEINNGK